MTLVTDTGRGAAVFASATPILPALDLDRAIAFYEQQLGFAESFRREGYAGLKRDAVEIHLWHCDDHKIPDNTSCYILVRDVGALYASCEAALPHRADRVATILEPLEMQPWGSEMFALRDTEGNLLYFGEHPE
jgi:uncharacterized glyoxalase superfamily protein PhnB